MSGRQLATVKRALEQRNWLNERYVRRLISERRIPFFKVGGKVLIDLEDLDRLVEAGRVDAR
jgi:excisionase family DNA binding protein